MVLHRLQAPVTAYGMGPSMVPSAQFRELAAGEIVDVVERFNRWMRVRLPAEDIDPLSQKTILMENSLIPCDVALEPTRLQVNDRVAGRFSNSPSHLVMKFIWWAQQDRYLPWKPSERVEKFFSDHVVEHFPGKISGASRDGCFVIQRGKGAIPERLACLDWCILDRKQRMRRSFAWAYGGMLLAWGVGGATFALSPRPRRVYQRYVGWLVWCSLIVAPFSALGTYAYAQSAFSSAVMSSSLCGLLFHDLFYE